MIEEGIACDGLRGAIYPLDEEERLAEAILLQVASCLPQQGLVSLVSLGDIELCHLGKGGLGLVYASLVEEALAP